MGSVGGKTLRVQLPRSNGGGNAVGVKFDSVIKVSNCVFNFLVRVQGVDNISCCGSKFLELRQCDSISSSSIRNGSDADKQRLQEEGDDKRGLHVDRGIKSGSR